MILSGSGSWGAAWGRRPRSAPGYHPAPFQSVGADQRFVIGLGRFANEKSISVFAAAELAFCAFQSAEKCPISKD